MAIVKSKKGEVPSGKAGRICFRNTKSGIVMVQLPDKVNNPQTPKQQRGRLLMSHLTQFFTVLKEELPYAFEGKAPGKTDTNAFVAANYHGEYPVFLPELWRKNHATVLAPYQVTDGYLPHIHTHKSGSLLRSDISLGDLAVGESTTIGALSKAIIANNGDMLRGDVILYLECWQEVDDMGVPHVSATCRRLRLNPADRHSARTLTEGFCPCDGFLGQDSEAEGHADGAAWIHLRQKEEQFHVSPQHLVVRDISKVLRYGTEEALMNAVNKLKWNDIEPF